MRKSSLFFLYLFIQVLVLGGLLTHASYEKEVRLSSLQEKANLVHRLGLTDLCLFTEASYTRHVTLADFHTAFQNSPMALEHFPSGSLMTPPQATKKMYDKVD